MIAEKLDGTWTVLVPTEELQTMEAGGAAPAEEAARLLDLQNVRTEIYRGRRETLLFLREGEERCLFWFPDLETLLKAAALLKGAGESRLYAPERGYLLEIPGSAALPMAFWDLGRRVPTSAGEQSKLLLGPDAVEMLQSFFG